MLIRLAVLLSLFVAVSEARAQGGVPPTGSFDAILVIISVADGTFAAAGAVTGIGSTIKLAQGKRSVPWFVSSAATGVINLALGIGALYLSPNNRYGQQTTYDPGVVAVGVGHLLVGLWNVLTPTLGFLRTPVRGEVAPVVTPMVLGGQGPSGSRWNGLGVQFTGF